MTQQPYMDVVASVNASLKARDVIRILGFRPDGLTVVGTKLKGYCPIHRGETFKSLQIDEQTGTCQCIVRDCPGYEPHSLLKLYALARQRQPIAAALELASELGIVIDAETRQSIAAHYAGLAGELVVKGKMAPGLDALKVALAATPDDLGLGRRAAELLEAAGDLGAAADQWLALAARLETSDPAQAIELLQANVLRLQPAMESAIMTLSRLLQAHAPNDRRWIDFRRERARNFLEQDRRADAIAELEAVLPAVGDDVMLLTEYGDLLREEGRHPEAAAVLDRALRLATRAGDHLHAARLGERLVALNPNDEATRERAARLRARAGEKEAFQREFLSLARLAFERGDSDRAEELLLELEQEGGGGSDSLALLAEIAQGRGDRDAHLDHLIRLAELSPPEGLSARLEAILALDPQDVGQMARVGTLCEKSGMMAHAIELHTRTALIYVALQEEALARSLLRRLAHLDPRSEDRRARIVDNLLENDQKRLASEYIAEVARELVRVGDREIAADLLEHGLARCGSLEELEKLAIRLLCEIDARDRFLKVFTTAWDRLIRFDRFEEAETVVVECLDFFPGDAALLEKLADLMLMTDRLEEGRAVLMEISESPLAPLELRIRAVEQAVELDLGDYDSLLFLSHLLEEKGDLPRAASVCHQAAELLLEEGETEKALQAIERAAQLQPGDARLKEFAGELALRSGDEAHAEELFIEFARLSPDGRNAWRRVVERLPQSTRLRFGQAEWLVQENDPAAAAEVLMALADELPSDDPHGLAADCFRRALELAPTNHRVRLRNARLLLAEDPESAEAVTLLRAAVEDATTTETALEAMIVLHDANALEPHEVHELADGLAQRGSRFDGLERLRRLLPTTQGEGRLPLLEHLFALGEDALEIREEYAAVLEMENRLPAASAQLGEVAAEWERRAEPRRALAFLRRAAELDPTNLDNRLRLLQLLQSLGHWLEAEELAAPLAHRLGRAARHQDVKDLLRPLLDRRPAQPALQAILGRAHAALKETELARECFSYAAGLHEAGGDLDEAADTLGRMLDLDPSDLALHEHRAALLKRARRTDEARKAYWAILPLLAEGDRMSLLPSVVRELEELGGTQWEHALEIAAWLEQSGLEDEALESVARFVERADAAGDSAAALEAVNHLISSRPEDPDLTARRGCLLATLGRLQEAEDAFARVASLTRASTDWLLGIVLLAKGMEVIPRSESIRRNLMEFYLASGDSASAAHVGLTLIDDWHTQDRNEEACLLAEVLLVALPERVDIALLRADLLLEDGRGDAAVTGLREYAAVHARSRPELAQKAYSYIVDRFTESSEDLATLSALVLRNEGVEAARPLQRRALDLLARQTFDNDHFKALAGQLIDADLDNETLRFRYIDILAERGERDEAHRQAMWLATRLRAQERYAEAVECVRRALDLVADLATRALLAEFLEVAGERHAAAATWLLLAAKYHDRGDVGEQIDALRHVIRLEPSNPEGLFPLVDALRQTPRLARDGERVALLEAAVECARSSGDPGRLCRLLEEAVGLSPDDPHLLEALADVQDQLGLADVAAESRLAQVRLLGRLGEPLEALRVAEAALEKRPESVAIRVELLPILLTMGNLPRYAEECGWCVAHARAGSDTAQAVAYLARGVEALLERKSSPLAKELLSEFADLVEDVPDLGMLEARVLQEQGDAAGSALRWSRLAERHREEGEVLRAEECLRRARELAPEDPMVRSGLIAILRLQDDSRRVELIAELESLANLLCTRGETAATIPVVREWLVLDESNPEALGLLAHLLTLEGEAGEARDLTLKLGAVLVERQAWDRAEDVYTRLVEDEDVRTQALRALMGIYDATDNVPGHLAVARELAACFDKLQLLEDANAIHEQIAERHPDDLESRERLAEFHQQADNQDASAKWLLELGRVAIARGALEKAAETLNRADKLLPDDPRPPELLASLYEKLQDRAEATSYLLTAATRRMKNENTDEALAVLERLLQLDPWNASAHEMRAGLYARRGDVPAATKEWELLAHFYQSGELAELEAQALEKILELNPSASNVRERLAMLLGTIGREVDAITHMLTLALERQAADDLSGAIELMETAQSLDPDDPRCYERLVELYLADGQREEADETALWLVDHHAWANEWGEAIHILQRAPSLGTSGELQLRLAELWRETGDHAQEKEALERALPLLEGKPAARRQALLGLFELEPLRRELLQELVSTAAEVHNWREVVELTHRAVDALLNHGEIDDARTLLAETAARLPDPRDLHAVAAQLYRQHSIPELAAAELVAQATLLQESGADEQALPILDEALSIKPADVQALTLRTRILMAAGRHDEALPGALQLLDLLGERDQVAPAMALAEDLVAALPSSTEARNRLIRLLALRHDVAAQTNHLRELSRLYAEEGRAEDAAASLRALLQLVPDDTRARAHYIDVFRQVGDERELVGDYLALAAHHGRKGAIAEASRLYRKVLELDPTNHDAHEDLIRLLMTHQRRDEAVAEACRLARLLVDQRLGRRAVEILQALGVRDGVSAEFHESLGAAYLSVNSRGQAMREWRFASTIHKEAGNASATARVISQMLAVDPLNLEIRQQLIESHLAAGHEHEALVAMEDLAERYLERGLCDLAEAEARRIIARDPEHIAAWKLLFKAALALGDERELIPDYLEFADMLARIGETRESLDHYLKVMSLDPRNLRAHRGYVIQYPKIGNHRDIVEEILAYAQLLIEHGHVEEAVRHFELVMSIDPSNTYAREMLSATQGGHHDSSHGPPSDVFRIPSIDGEGRIESSFDSRLTESQRNFIREKSISASDYLAGTLDALEKQESEEALSQVVSNYRTILAANAQNAQMRIKLADILEQMGRIPEMLQELVIASDTLFQRGELAACVMVCERYLALQPTDGRMRKRLSEAVVKRDAMKALESAISYYDDDSSTGGHSRP